nr:hypothetical protein [Tanacetum cinerariifolium]
MTAPRACLSSSAQSLVFIPDLEEDSNMDINKNEEDEWEEDDDWLMDSVTPPRATSFQLSTYELGGPSAAVPEAPYLVRRHLPVVAARTLDEHGKLVASKLDETKTQVLEMRDILNKYPCGQHELLTLTLKGDDIKGYNNRFHELSLMCPKLVTPEKNKIECYIRRLPERIKANVTSSKPANLHGAINRARELVEQAIQAKATRIGESNKRRWEDHQGFTCHGDSDRYISAPCYVNTAAL